jgi:hypothetical protein
MNFEHDGTADTVQTTFDPGSESAVRTVVETVATAIDADPLDMEPFGNHVDPDALETLCRAGERPGDWELQFHYEGTAIRVTGDGDVRVRPAE